MRLKLFSIICVFLFNNCTKTEMSKDAPTCIDSKIEGLKKLPVQNPPAEVWKWKDNGNSYYYITSDCCDQFNLLYDDNCNLVCAPDGGFTGNGDGKCPEFSSDIVKTLIWKDHR